MPTAVYHRWTDLPIDKPMPLMERQRVMAEKAMVSRLVLKRGFSVPVHAHENEQISLVVSGRLRFHIEDSPGATFRILEVGAGEVLVLPSMVGHGAEALEDTVVFDIFSPPSQTTGVDQKPRG